MFKNILLYLVSFSITRYLIVFLMIIGGIDTAFTAFSFNKLIRAATPHGFMTAVWCGVGILFVIALEMVWRLDIKQFLIDQDDKEVDPEKLMGSIILPSGQIYRGTDDQIISEIKLVKDGTESYWTELSEVARERNAERVRAAILNHLRKFKNQRQKRRAAKRPVVDTNSPSPTIEF